MISHFQVLVNHTHLDFFNHYIFIYMDNILVFSKTLLDHQNLVFQVF